MLSMKTLIQPFASTSDWSDTLSLLDLSRLFLWSSSRPKIEWLSHLAVQTNPCIRPSRFPIRVTLRFITKSCKIPPRHSEHIQMWASFKERVSALSASNSTQRVRGITISWPSASIITILQTYRKSTSWVTAMSQPSNWATTANCSSHQFTRAFQANSRFWSKMSLAYPSNTSGKSQISTKMRSGLLQQRHICYQMKNARS